MKSPELRGFEAKAFLIQTISDAENRDLVWRIKQNSNINQNRQARENLEPALNYEDADFLFSVLTNRNLKKLKEAAAAAGISI